MLPGTSHGTHTVPEEKLARPGAADRSQRSPQAPVRLARAPRSTAAVALQHGTYFPSSDGRAQRPVTACNGAQLAITEPVVPGERKEGDMARVRSVRWSTTPARMDHDVQTRIRFRRALDVRSVPR